MAGVIVFNCPDDALYVILMDALVGCRVDIQALLYDIDFTKQDVDEEYRKSLYDFAISLKINTLNSSEGSSSSIR